MEEIKNVIVEQKDIYDIINAFKDYYQAKQVVFDETERLVKEEEAKYNEWNEARYKSNDFANFPEFKRQTFQNKRTSASLTIVTPFIFL